jgi:Transcriptional regulator/sugar kinase
MMENSQGLRILTIDIGGSHVKATILNETGQMIKDYEKKTTPVPATPENIISTIKELVKDFPEFDKISVGFPGFVKNGTVMTAPNLGSQLWQNIPFQNMISDSLGKPAQVINDADLQGLGVVKGNGLEIVVTLGTGFGTAVLFNGKLLPHLELAHHPITKHKDYDQYIGEKALINIGDDKWNRRMQKVLGILKTVFNYDHLYISGGNASRLRLKAESNITIVTNKDGIKGGAKLWI